MVERKNRSSKSSRKDRKSRKVSRKNRKVNRKSRKVSRRCDRKSSRKSRRMSGGGDYSLAQGTQFAGYHSNQHGGAAVLGGAPLDYTGVLDAGLRDSARVGGYDKFFNEASGMTDGTPATINITQNSQSGGSRSSKRKNVRKNRSSKRKNVRKNRSSKRNAKKNRSSSKRRAQHGGQSPVDAPTMLLSRDAAMRAGTGDFSNPLLKH